MEKIDDEALSKFLDGELDPVSAAQIRVDPEQARRAATLSEQDRTIGEWFDTQLSEPPTEIERAVRTAFAVRGAGRHFDARRWLLPIAAAIAVAVLGVASFDYLIERRVGHAIEEMRAERASDMTLLARAMQEVLETRESGSPVSFRNETTGFNVTLVPRRTWRSESGHWCREFVEIFGETKDEGSPVSTACRAGDGHWMRVRTELPPSLAPFLPLDSPGKSL